MKPGWGRLAKARARGQSAGVSFRIAIDGTFASGKGTLARRLAAHYGLAHLDTGRIYRATALAVLEAGGDPDSERDGLRGVERANFARLDDPRLTDDAVAQAASRVSVHPGVRAALLEMQRRFARDTSESHPGGGAVLDGRDIGTVVLPGAEVKLFVDAEAEVRARRRFEELAARGDAITEAEVRASLEERDGRDRTRAQAPLKPAEDAHLLDTTDLSIDAAFERARDIVDAVRAVR